MNSPYVLAIGLRMAMMSYDTAEVLVFAEFKSRDNGSSHWYSAVGTNTIATETPHRRYSQRSFQIDGQLTKIYPGVVYMEAPKQQWPPPFLPQSTQPPYRN